MTTPRATYRLQFREHLDLAGGAEIAPYLARLGVSHLYASPLQTAREGSTHGYDGIDFAAIEPAIGGMQGFHAMAEALRKAGLRLLLDIVPNHMGVTPANGWWHDVLEWGGESPYAGHFDIDWQAPRLLLPILGKSYADALAAGELKLDFDAGPGAFTLSYYDTVLPLTPPSFAMILADCEDEKVQALARRFAVSSPHAASELKQALRACDLGGIRKAVNVIAEDRDRLHALLEMQPWRLVHWRNARERLTYRRFFEISDLVGVRVESPAVFADVHRLVLDLVAEGMVDGLRIDHVDGLADPREYLQRLRDAVGRDVFIVVEKILGPEEVLRATWPIAGTTGYEFITVLGHVLTDEGKAAELDAAYAGFIGTTPDYGRMGLEIKRRLFQHNLASELEVLTQALVAIADADVATRDLGPGMLRDAIVELACAMPVYRTYVDARGATAQDREILDGAAARALAARQIESPEAVGFLMQVLTLDVTPGLREQALRFALRFQQTTGPLMAKSIEDTLFYRFNRLIALNEVGGEPERVGRGVMQFHEAMAARAATQATGLSATATHDTKRGEDARARLYALSEMPEVWAAAAKRWSLRNASHARILDGQRWPEPEMEWFLYQSLLGAWPLDLDVADAEGIAALRVRMAQLAQKAAREAKVHTTWTGANDAYETALAEFIEAVLEPGKSAAFLEDFLAVARPVMVAGALNSLTQLLVKLAEPGVPDIYQGTELWDLSLVDPDNRRAVDFAHRAAMAEVVAGQSPADLVAAWRSGALKMRLMLAGLALRRDLDGWEHAPYVPALAHGLRAHHVVAFARTLDHAAVLAVGVRLPLSLLREANVPLVPAERWGDTRLLPPDELAGLPLVDAVTGERVVLPREGLPIAEILRHFPVALLSTAPA